MTLEAKDTMYVGICMTAQKAIENKAYVDNDITIKGEMVGEAIQKGETVELDFSTSDKENDETEFSMLAELPEGAVRSGQKIIFTPVREGEYVFSAAVKDMYHETPVVKTIKVNVAPVISIKLNGNYVSSDVSPYIVNDRTMVPVRVISESLGAEVIWNQAAETVTIKKDGKDIVLRINSDNADVNGESVKLDAPAVIEQSRTFVPIRFISENLGWNVDWEQDSYTVNISK